MKLRGRPGTRARAVPAALVALLLVSGCGEITPGTATVVNGTRITDDEVSELADAQCVLRGTLSEEGTAPPTSTARVKQESLGLLMEAELSRQFGDDEDLTPDELFVEGFFGQVEPIFEPLPAKARAEFTSVFEDWSRGRAILVEAGSEETGQEPTLQNLEQLLTAGLQARDAWMKEAKITTNPRYAPDAQGFPAPGADGSVSRASSDFAKGGTATELDAEWVAGLPTGQKCG